MFDFIADEDRRGQVGIGTLIVFIGMVLVATIGAGVLINTAGVLQSSSEETGQQTTQQVTDRLQVISAIGQVNDGTAQRYRIESSTVDPDLNFAFEGELTFDVTAINGSIDLGSEGSLLYTVPEGNTEQFTVRYNQTDGLFYLSDGDTEYSITTLDISDQVLEEHPAGTVTFENGETRDITDLESFDFSVEPYTATTVTELNLLVTTGPGADEIDLRNATVHVIGPDGAYILGAEGTGTGDGNFTVESVRDADGSSPVLNEQDDRFNIIIELNSTVSGQPDEAVGGSEYVVRINTRASGMTIVRLEVPTVISGKSAIEL